MSGPTSIYLQGDSKIFGYEGALNWATGETVAVKEIQLSNIPKGELGQIMVSHSFVRRGWVGVAGRVYTIGMPSRDPEMYLVAGKNVMFDFRRASC